MNLWPKLPVRARPLQVTQCSHQPPSPAADPTRNPGEPGRAGCGSHCTDGAAEAPAPGAAAPACTAGIKTPLSPLAGVSQHPHHYPPWSLLSCTCRLLQAHGATLLGQETRSGKKRGHGTWLASSPSRACSFSWAWTAALLSCAARALSGAPVRRRCLPESSGSWVLRHGRRKVLTQEAVNTA